MPQQPEGQDRERMMREFQLRDGAGTYNARVRGKSLADRRTRPVTQRYFIDVTECGECQMCQGPLEARVNPHGGGYFHACTAPGCDYYIGLNGEKIQ